MLFSLKMYCCTADTDTLSFKVLNRPCDNSTKRNILPEQVNTLPVSFLTWSRDLALTIYMVFEPDKDLNVIKDNTKVISSNLLIFPYGST